uniref:BMA-ROM-1, isoform a n=4 Tax=Brugia TaxID=6278 RepID=A0A1U7F179_BRUMA|nr:BMA-ROM-1, isoform b [Brugia malayi]CRZ24543.1 BMA-ROM-1, isoform a [Brugia malayi]
MNFINTAYLCYIQMANKRSAQEVIAQEFDKLDSDGDGMISLNEIHHLLNDNFNRNQIELTGQQIRLLLKEADRNRDNVLDFSEFSQLVTSADAQKKKLKVLMYSVADTIIAKTDRPIVHTYIDEYNCMPPPIFVLCISILQVSTFVYYMYGRQENPFTYCAGCWVDGTIGPFLFAPSLRYQAWRFFSYQFMHQGILHLLPNVIFQLVIGVPLELVHKMWRIAIIYLLAVCLGALLQYALDPSVYLVGCSAGVYALLGAHLSNVIVNWAEMPFRLVRLFIISAYVFTDTASTVYRRFQVNECDRVSYTAHIAGVVTGVLMGVVILHNLKVLYWERILMTVSLILFGTIFLLLTAMVIFVSPFSKPIWDTIHCKNEPNLLDSDDFYTDFKDY